MSGFKSWLFHLLTVTSWASHLIFGASILFHRVSPSILHTSLRWPPGPRLRRSPIPSTAASLACPPVGHQLHMPFCASRPLPRLFPLPGTPCFFRHASMEPLGAGLQVSRPFPEHPKARARSSNTSLALLGHSVVWLLGHCFQPSGAWDGQLTLLVALYRF